MGCSIILEQLDSGSAGAWGGIIFLSRIASLILLGFFLASKLKTVHDKGSWVLVPVLTRILGSTWGCACESTLAGWKSELTGLEFLPRFRLQTKLRLLSSTTGQTQVGSGWNATRFPFLMRAPKFLKFEFDHHSELCGSVLAIKLHTFKPLAMRRWERIPIHSHLFLLVGKLMEFSQCQPAAFLPSSPTVGAVVDDRS
jgi:hypothetical protein